MFNKIESITDTNVSIPGGSILPRVEVTSMECGTFEGKEAPYTAIKVHYSRTDQAGTVQTLVDTLFDSKPGDPQPDKEKRSEETVNKLHHIFDVATNMTAADFVAKVGDTTFNAFGAKVVTLFNELKTAEPTKFVFNVKVAMQANGYPTIPRYKPFLESHLIPIDQTSLSFNNYEKKIMRGLKNNEGSTSEEGGAANTIELT